MNTIETVLTITVGIFSCLASLWFDMNGTETTGTTLVGFAGMFLVVMGIYHSR
jgi:hypothetical membrane protein